MRCIAPESISRRPEGKAIKQVFKGVLRPVGDDTHVLSEYCRNEITL